MTMFFIRMVGGLFAGASIMCAAHVAGLIAHYGVTPDGAIANASGSGNIGLGLLFAGLAAIALAAPGQKP